MMNKKIRVISCILTAAVMALIFFFSSQNSSESSAVSSGLTEQIVRFFAEPVGLQERDIASAVDAVHTVVRKAAHFTVFMMLGITSSFAVYANKTRRQARIFFIAVIFSMLYAVSDELHQLFVGGRAARVFDVFIDTCGAAAGAGVFAVMRAVQRRVKIRLDGWITITVLITAAIFMFSAQTSERSNELSHAVTEEIVDIASPVITPVVGEESFSVDELNAKVRKAAHFSLYFMLGLVMTAMMSKKGDIKIHKAFLVSFIVSSAYAVTDEWHQTFVDGRGAQVSDVLIDSCGAAAGAVVCAMLLLRIKKKNGNFIEDHRKRRQQ